VTDAGDPATRGPASAAVAEALILATIAAAPWPYGSAIDVARYIVAAVLLLAVAIWAFGLARARRPLPCLAAPAFALPALALVQALLDRSVARVFTVEAAALLAAMCGVLVFWSKRGRDAGAALRLVLVVLATCGAQAIFGAVQWSVDPSRIYGEATPYVTMPFGSYVNHNHFAGLVGMGAVLAAGLAVAHVHRRGEMSPAALASGGAALGLAAAHLASRSRGGLIALLGGLAALGALWLAAVSLRGERRRSAAAVVAVAVALMVGFGWAAIPGTTRRHLATAFAGPVDGSGAYRVDVAAATMRAFADRPLMGWGLGAYEDAAPAYKRAHGDVRVRHAESDVLEWFAEGGLFGLALVAWLVVEILRGLRGRQTDSRDRFRNAVALAAAGGAATMLVHSLIDFNLRLPANALVFVALAGLAASPRNEPRAFGGRWLAGALAAACLVLAFGCAWRAAGARTSEHALAARDPLRRLALLDRALAEHPYAAEMFRARARLWRDLAWRPPGWNAARLARAEADLRRALELRPRWGEAWADLGWVRAFQGDAAGARAAMQAAVDLDPTHVDIGIAAAELLARQGDLDGAVERLRRLRGVHPGWTDDRARAVAARWTQDPARLAKLAPP
jgi:O-antigen ligase